MQKSLIQNFDELAVTSNRKMALEIMESGLKAINTKEVIFNSVKLTGNVLNIEGQSFDLSKFKKIKIVGFGKSSPEAALALENILGGKIDAGVVIGLSKINLKYIETFVGSHPRPSEVNFEAGEKIYKIAENATEDDLVIVIVSGGGSALLCHGKEECESGIKLYDSFLKSGKTIAEINTVRKHLSFLKGGGLAKIAYPATIVALIFSDIPGDNFENVASGPTYKDMTTVDDANKIIRENNLGEFNLIETPKEDKYFEKVHNFVLVSNQTAVEAMAQKAQEFNLETDIISTRLFDEASSVLKKIFSSKLYFHKENSVVLAAGEPSIVISPNRGKGGRNMHMGLLAIKNKTIDENTVFISFASDGMDNSDAAGVVVDKINIKNAEKLRLDVDDYLERFDSYSFFSKAGGIIKTGPTGANVSDLMILLKKKL